MIDRQQLLERFLRYVAMNTTADEAARTYPSSAGQIELGQLLVRELQSLGIEDVHQDTHGLVLATLDSNVDRDVPVVAFNAHLDTSPETTGANVRPRVLQYQGGDIPLSNDVNQVIRRADNPELESLVGCTLITTDGTTLLGADDKAGVAIIMQAVTALVEHPELPHGSLRVLFTCDEEIGHGIDHVDIEQLGADVAYTLDGEGADSIDVETFSADLAHVTFRGVNIHPSIAKGRMVNAVRAAGRFLDCLPRDTLAPETSADREGFLHPYVVVGGVAEVKMKVLLRDFETATLSRHARLLEEIARRVEGEIDGIHIDIDIQTQYRNMADGLREEPRAVQYAEEAHRRLGRTPRRTIIRGGTDGSMLTEKGLPTPNLASGQHTPHSPLEWACLEQMQQAAELLIALVAVWAEKGQDAT